MNEVLTHLVLRESEGEPAPVGMGLWCQRDLLLSMLLS